MNVKEYLREGKGITKDRSARGSLKRRQRSQLWAVPRQRAIETRRENEYMNACAPLLPLLKGMRDLVALAHEILSVKSLVGSCSTRQVA